MFVLWTSLPSFFAKIEIRGPGELARRLRSGTLACGTLATVIQVPALQMVLEHRARRGLKTKQKKGWNGNLHAVIHVCGRGCSGHTHFCALGIICGAQDWTRVNFIQVTHLILCIIFLLHLFFDLCLSPHLEVLILLQTVLRDHSWWDLGDYMRCCCLLLYFRSSPQTFVFVSWSSLIFRSEESSWKLNNWIKILLKALRLHSHWALILFYFGGHLSTLPVIVIKYKLWVLEAFSFCMIMVILKIWKLSYFWAPLLRC